MKTTTTPASPTAKRAISSKAKAKAPPSKTPTRPKALPPWLIKAKKKQQKVRKQG